MKEKDGNLWQSIYTLCGEMDILDGRINAHLEHFEKVAEALEGVTRIFGELEKRIAPLESKPSETASDRHLIDFEGADATKASNAENESDMERLNAKDVLADLCHCTCWECGRRR